MAPIDKQVILITGATDGLALELARQGASLLLHGRSDERGQRTVDLIREQTGSDRLSWYRADFDEFAQVRSLAERVSAEHEHLDGLLNNAGLGVDPVRRVSADGYEATFQVDYLAPYMLCHLLEPLIVASAPSRIVNVSSAGQAPIDFDDVMLERRYDGVQAYCQAKLAEVMLTIDRAAELQGSGVSVNCLHPASMMPTKIVTNMFSPMSEIADGVRSVVRLCVDPELEGVTGTYFNTTRPERANPQAYDPNARARLRALAQQLTGVPAGRTTTPARAER